MKKQRNRVLAVILAIAMIAGNISGLSISVSAQGTDGDSSLGNSPCYYAQELVAEYDFGTGITKDTVYTQEKGYGFRDVTYPNAAPGWVSSVYYPRVPAYSETAGYVNTVSGSTTGTDVLEISGKGASGNTSCNGESSL